MFDLPRLAASNLIAQLDHHESLGSTSDRALELAATTNVKFPLLVLANEQTAGRGRGANRWFSDSGALTFSLALEATPSQLPPDRWPEVALTTGLALCEALTALAPTADLRLKWPNDLYLANKKIAGILSESVPGSKNHLIIGVGINVNNSLNPKSKIENPKSPDLTNIATSLKDHDNLSRDLTATLLTILDHFDHRWHSLLDDGFGNIAAEFRQRCLLTGKTVTIQPTIGPPLIGICRGIDDHGRLRVQTADQEIAVISGTISHWE
jgi:BirA family biotin operon repressor/biotin-[acetyl-CoA-carboxylase] ligase